MPSPTYYNTGTASVANGATAIAFEGALLGTADAPNFIGGDLFCDPAQPLVPPQRIASVDYDAGTAALAVGWPGTTMTDAAYEVRYVGDTVRSTAQTRRLLEQLSVVQANGRGLFFRFSTLTGDVELDPGYLALNNADPAAATLAALSNTDANGASVSAEIDTWDDADSTVRGKLWVRSVSRPAVFRSYAVTGTVVTATGRRKLTLVHVGGGGSLTEDEELMAFFVPNGNKGDSFQYDVAVANAAARAAYDGEPEGFVVLELDNGATPSRTVFWRMGAGGSGDWELIAYLTGEAGVTPRGGWLTATVYALNDLVTYGGNAYVCTEAHTSDDFATDLAASKWVLFVAQGAKGWSPQLVAEADGARRVMKLAGYVGGAGTAPTNNVGEYLKADGTFTANIAEALDFRGATGPAGVDGAGILARVRVVDTAEGDPDTDYEAGDTVDSVVLDESDIVLRATAGGDPIDGLYVVPAAGAAPRHSAFDVFDDLAGMAINVMEGSTYADTLWRCLSDKGGVLDTDPLVFEEFEAGGGGSSGANDLFFAHELADLKGAILYGVGLVADGYDSEAGIDTAASTNENYSASDDSYSPTFAETTEGSSGVGTNQAAGATFTIFDMAWKIDNGSTVTKIGVYDSAGANGYKVKIGKRNSAGNFDIVVDEVLAHAGGGWQDKTLASPFVVPGTGDYYAGMANTDGASGNINVLTGTDRAAKSGDVTGLGQTGFTETLASNVEPVRVTYQGAPNNMTLVSNAVTLVAQPEQVRIATFIDPQEAMTINTDYTIEATRDGGTTWTAGTLAPGSNPVGTVEQYEATIDLSGQPAGSSFKYRKKTLNNKSIKDTGVAFKF